MNLVRQRVTVVLAAELDGARCSFAYESPPRRIASPVPRSLAERVLDGDPPRSFAAISCSFSRASGRAARFARVHRVRRLTADDMPAPRQDSSTCCPS